MAISSLALSNNIHALYRAYKLIRKVFTNKKDSILDTYTHIRIYWCFSVSFGSNWIYRTHRNLHNIVDSNKYNMQRISKVFCITNRKIEREKSTCKWWNNALIISHFEEWCVQMIIIKMRMFWKIELVIVC